MSEFCVQVVMIDNVVDHPNADRLTLVQIKGYTCIANKDDDGSWRYNAGDFVVYVPEGAIVPEWALRQYGYWNTEKNEGYLDGSNHDRVKARKLRGVFSLGLLIPVRNTGSSLELLCNDNVVTTVVDGQDVADILGVTKYVPVVPTHMTGEMCNISGHTVKYDLENYQRFPDMIELGALVIVSEKLHGTNCQIGYVPGLNHPDLFGTDGCFYVASKGLGAQGLVFMNNEANVGNIYVRALKKLLDDGLEDCVRSLSCMSGDVKPTIHIIGEIFGLGVQDLTYGFSSPEFRVFDVKVDGVYITHTSAVLGVDPFKDITAKLKLMIVPILYEGPFDPDAIEKVRDGQDTYSGKNIREGIVIKDASGDNHSVYGRKVVKWVSPDYLLRKNKNATEFT